MNIRDQESNILETPLAQLFPTNKDAEVNKCPTQLTVRQKGLRLKMDLRVLLK